MAWLDGVIGVPPVEPGARGDPGLFGPGSTVWQIGRERALMLAGPAALLLQIAHPLVAAGVAAHSGFGRDPISRLRGTLAAVLAISFGDRRQADLGALAVRRVHGRVKGRLDHAAGPHAAGTPFDAEDPALAMWVHATLVHMALEAFGRLVRTPTADERARYVEESKRFAALFGVTADVMPADLDGFDTYVAEAMEGLWVSESAVDMARRILSPPVPAVLRPAVPAIRVVTAAMLPPHIREAYGLRWGGVERMAFAGVTRSVRGTLRAWPASVRFWPHYRAALARLGGPGPEGPIQPA